MSAVGCLRRADRRPAVSGVPRSADIFRYRPGWKRAARGRAESRSLRDRRARPLAWPPRPSIQSVTYLLKYEWPDVAIFYAMARLANDVRLAPVPTSGASDAAAIDGAEEGAQPYCVGDPAGCSTAKLSKSVHLSAALRDRGMDRRAMRASLEGMALLWSHVYKQVTTLGPLISPTPVSCRNSIRCHQKRARCLTYAGRCACRAGAATAPGGSRCRHRSWRNGRSQAGWSRQGCH